MSHAGGRRTELPGAKVFLHQSDEKDAATLHIDIEHAVLAGIFQKGESSFAGASEGGIFVQLRKVQQDRAGQLLK
ncbi:MAG: hypothetical protein ACT4PT_09195 [Methanobacteriota archaeon]